MLVNFIFTLVKQQNFLFSMRIISQIMLDNKEDTKIHTLRKPHSIQTSKFDPFKSI